MTMIEFKITGEYIELFKLLKATHLCGTGGEAKIMIGEGLVTVEGEAESRLRRKVKPGMTVEYDGHVIRVN